jgi:AcrR family transcriptional regulator
MQLTHESGRVKKTVEGPKGRTRRLLLEHASILLGQGQIASVAEVAQHAGVSRATAYRYFPTRGKMISAVVDFSLGVSASRNSSARPSRASGNTSRSYAPPCRSRCPTWRSNALAG